MHLRPAALIACTLIASAIGEGCSCGGNYPKGAAGAALQQNALNLRIAADTLRFVQTNLEAILRKNFEVDPTGQYVTIYLPEASDSSAKVFCDESGLYPNAVPPCDYKVRIRDGCIGPGEQDASGKCQPDLFKPRETMKSWIRIKIAELSNHLSFVMEDPGVVDYGGFRLVITDLPVDVNLGIYAKLPAIAGQQLGNFACRYFAPPAMGGGEPTALVLQKIDISIQPRVDDVNGTSSFFVTSLTRDFEIGMLNVVAAPVADPSCVNTSPNELTCEAACSLINSLLGPTAEGFNFVNDLLKPAFPYIITPLANGALAFLWGDSAEFNATIPVGKMSFIAKSSGRDVSIMAGAQPGAFQVTERPDNKLTQGMALPMQLGAYAQLSPCVNETAAPPAYPDNVAPTLDGLVQLQDPQLAPGVTYDETYHVGFSISESFFNQLAFALRNSGMLCVSLGSDPGGLLATGSFIPNAGLLYLLAPPLSDMAPPSAPITFRIQPGTSPNVRFGTGKQIGVDKDGKPIRDSLITLTLFDTGLEFHLFAWDRYIRTFAINVDVVVGLSAFPSRDGKLMLSIDSIQANNIVEVFNELMPNYDFSRITEVLFAILASQLNQKSLSFEVPITQAIKDAIGDGDFGVHLLDVRREGAKNDYLSGFVKLCTRDEETDASNIGCFILPGPPARDAAPPHRFDALLSEVVYEDAPALLGDKLRALRADRVPAGAAKIMLASDQPLEYQVAVDSGTFGPFVYPSAQGMLYVEHPALRMLGHHTLRVRAKPFGRPYDGGISDDVYVPVLVDSERPHAKVIDGKLALEDLVTPRDLLRVQIIDGGVESEWMTPAEADARIGTASPDVIVRAMDEAQNISIDPRLFVQDFEQPAAAPQKSGCNAGGAASLWLVALVLVAARRRRVRAR
jgi:hypothetical protein